MRAPIVLASLVAALGGCDVAIDHFRPDLTPFPTENNTGYAWTGGTLTPYAGTALSTGTRLVNVDIQQCLVITGDNVSIVRSRIKASCGDSPIVDVTGANLLLEDVEIDGNENATASAVEGGLGLVLRRVQVHGAKFGVVQRGSRLTIEESLIRVDEYGFLDESFSQVRLHHNAFESAGGEGAVIFWNNHAEVDDVLVDYNRFASGGKYALQCGSGPDRTRPSKNARFIGNTWAPTPSPAGPDTYCVPVDLWQDNHDEETNKPVLPMQ